MAEELTAREDAIKIWSLRPAFGNTQQALVVILHSAMVSLLHKQVGWVMCSFNSHECGVMLGARTCRQEM